MIRLRRRLAGDQGIGLPELIVTMVLLAIVSTLILTLVTTVSRTFTRDRSATDSTNVAAIGMNELTRVIRGSTELRLTGGGSTNAPAFVSATPNELTVYAYIDADSASPAPVRVRFSIDSQRRLIETRWKASTTAAPWSFVATGSPTSSRPVARLIPTSAPALFTYLDANGNVLVPPGTGFTTEQLRKIAAVQITLTVQADLTDRAQPVTLQNAVGIPNLGISRVRP